MERTWLVHLRQKAGLTQRKLAEKANISRNYLCEIEKGRKTPSGPVAIRIAKILSFNMELFYTQIGRDSRTLRRRSGCSRLSRMNNTMQLINSATQ